MKPNILVDEDLCAKVADFGLSVFAQGQSQNYASQRGGNYRWMAPELLSYCANGSSDSDNGTVPRLTFESDIWSFGMLVYEVCVAPPLRVETVSRIDYSSYTLAKYRSSISTPTGQLLWQSCTGMKGRRESTCSTEVPDEVWALMQRCWVTLPKDRPTASECLVVVGSL